MAERIEAPGYARQVLEALEQGGCEAWFVGGCVRDSLMGRAPVDWDIAAGPGPVAIERALAGRYTLIRTGEKHGTVTALSAGRPVEITAFRAETGYADHRHPDAVRFVDRLDEDLARRDFTVNALAYHPRRGLVDRFGGQADLAAGVLRCVGDPGRRFAEDALRILRGLRFAACLGFSLEAQTARAAVENRELLREISRERVLGELEKLLCAPHAAQVLDAFPSVLFTVLPELSPMEHCTQEHPCHRGTVWQHTLWVLEAAPAEPVLRWAALLHDCGKPGTKTRGPDGIAHFYGHAAESEALAREICSGLRMSGREADRVCALVRCHGEVLPMAPKRVKKLLARLGEEDFFGLLELIRADWTGQATGLLEERLPALEETRRRAEDLLAQGACLGLGDLAVNGDDLLELGFAPGPGLGRALDRLLEAVLEDRLPNRRAALLEEARTLLGTGP